MIGNQYMFVHSVIKNDFFRYLRYYQTYCCKIVVCCIQRIVYRIYMCVCVCVCVCVYVYTYIHIIFLVQLLSHVQLFMTQWTAACQASLSSTISQSFLKFMSIELVILSNHLMSSPPFAFNQGLFQ